MNTGRPAGAPAVGMLLANTLASNRSQPIAAHFSSYTTPFVPSSYFVMKKTLFLLAALAFSTAGTSFAQTAPVAASTKQGRQHAPKDPAKMADRKAGKMAKELGLTADQEAKVEQLLLARQQEGAALKAKYGADKKAGRTEMKASHEKYQAQLKTILTPAQYAKFDQMKDEHHGHGRGQGGGKTKVKAKA